jgi:hypothetical protein
VPPIPIMLRAPSTRADAVAVRDAGRAVDAEGSAIALRLPGGSAAPRRQPRRHHPVHQHRTTYRPGPSRTRRGRLSAPLSTLKV